ncbi:ArsR family transcriptional regulator [Candidatus Woesearchaeota archaeon]|nr:MAG: ArsR family transcriptional regulator [Candidatus Woesearchaeota archaeon]
MPFTRITIIKSKRPSPGNVNEELQWFGGSLGLFNLRDKDKSCFRIFITLLKQLKTGAKLTSDAIAEDTGLSRGTVIHHLKKLMNAGLVAHYKNTYQLRVKTLEDLVTTTQAAINETMNELLASAKELDKQLNLKEEKK